jgi:hypothetical protein
MVKASRKHQALDGRHDGNSETEKMNTNLHKLPDYFLIREFGIVLSLVKHPVQD